MTDVIRAHHSSRQSRGPQDGKFQDDLNSAERDAAAAKLRIRGLTFAQIAEEIGYADHTGARKAVKRAMQSVRAEPVPELREMELARLDGMWQAALSVMERNHVSISGGKLVYIPSQDGTIHPVKDDGPVLQALDRMLKIMQRRADLLGLDAPKKSEVTVTDAVDAEIQRLAADLKSSDPSAGGVAGVAAGGEAETVGNTAGGARPEPGDLLTW